jgi:ribonuclease P protein component
MKIKALKGREVITALFKQGAVVKAPPLLMRYQKNDALPNLHLGVSVPKTKFKKAVDRNRVKRQLRAILQKNQAAVCDAFEHTGHQGMLLYLDNKIPESSLLESHLLVLLKALKEK